MNSYSNKNKIWIAIILDLLNIMITYGGVKESGQAIWLNGIAGIAWDWDCMLIVWTAHHLPFPNTPSPYLLNLSVPLALLT
jgi:hypothetical protein